MLVLTHFSSRYSDLAPLAEQARFRAGGAAVVAANDLDRIAFPRRRRTPST
jgi:ribonuclease Z